MKDVKDFEAEYAVTEDGMIWNKKRKCWLKQSSINGYCHVNLFKNGKHYNKYVHRIVFEAFYRTLQPNEEAHHINEVKNDNRAINLVALDKVEHMRRHKMGNTMHLGCHHSQQAKRKISQSNKGKKLSQESIAKRQQTKRKKRLLLL